MGKERILGVGLDIESIERFGNLDKVKNRNFLNKIYTSRELECCYAKKNPGPHLAEQFCGKEAVIKALKCMGHTSIHYNEIEIMNSEAGGPTVSILKGNRDIILQLSLSHSHDKAVAFVVAIKDANVSMNDC